MASTKIWNVEGRNVREDQFGLSDEDAALLDEQIALHTALWDEEPDHIRLCGACGIGIPKGFTHTAGCSALWPIWPL